MSDKDILMSNRGKLFFLFIMTLIIWGCASIDSRYTEVDEEQEFSKYMNSVINVLTYDQALMEWGQPLAQIEGDEIFVTTWGAEKAGIVAMPIGNMTYTFSKEHGWRLQLSFDKKTRKMVSWKSSDW